MEFINADTEFSGIALELYQNLHSTLGLTVHPSQVMFLRSSKKKKNAYAYCKLISREFRLLTDKKFFIVIVSDHFDELKTDNEKRHVILHELMHLRYDGDTEKYGLINHSLQDFHALLVNPAWNLEIVNIIPKKDTL